MAKKTQYFAGFRFSDKMIKEIEELRYRKGLNKTEFITESIQMFLDHHKQDKKIKCPVLGCGSDNTVEFSSDMLCQKCGGYFPKET